MTKKRLSISRRDALRLGALGTLGVGLNATLARKVAAFAPQSSSGHKMLLLFIRGGWDGIHVAIPYVDTTGYTPTNRGVLHIPQNLALPIESGNMDCMLHPAMADVAPMLADKKIVFMHRVGNPKRSGSHFDDQQFVETGIELCNPPSNLNKEEGWVARMGQNYLSGSFRGASVSDNLQQFFRTDNPDRIMSHIKRIRSFPNDALPYYSLISAKAGLDAKYRGQPGGTPQEPWGYGLRGQHLAGAKAGHDLDPFGRKAGLQMLDSEAAVLPLHANSYVPLALGPNQAKYPFGLAQSHQYFPRPQDEGLPPEFWVQVFFAQLRDAMWLLRMTDVQVVGVEIGGVDTHSDQGGLTQMGQVDLDGALAKRLRVIAYGMRSVYWESKADPNLRDRFTMLGVSEFGRTSRPNGADGTDHGAATLALAMGQGVKLNSGSMVYNCDGNVPTWRPGDMFSAGPGTYGCNPYSGPLTFIAMRTDFRAIWAEVLQKLYNVPPGAPTDAIIPGSNALPQLGFL